jgi:hypothetical protein
VRSWTTTKNQKVAASCCVVMQHFTSHSHCATPPCCLTLARAGNVMQALEDRTEKSRREMDLHDTIDTVRVLNARNQNIDIDKVIVQVISAEIFTSLSNMHSCFVILFCFRLERMCVSSAFTTACRLSRRGGRMTHWQNWSAAGTAQLPYFLSSSLTHLFTTSRPY